MPSAKVIVNANAEDINTSLEFVASTSATEANIGDEIIPATRAEANKEESQTAPATGEKDIGKKASGAVSMTAKKCSGNPFVPPDSVASGTTLSLDGRTYTTNNSVSFVGTGAEDGCYTYAGNRDANITASENGSEYNTSSANFSVSGRSDVSATGSASGGSSKVVKVVSQQDVDNAKSKLSISDDSVKTELIKELGDLYAIDASFEKANEKTTVSPEVGQEASEVKVTYSANFSMLGVSENDLNELLKQSISNEINPDEQEIQNNGLGQATFTIKEVRSDGSMVITLSTVVTVGPDIDEAKLKEEIAGKKSGESENIVKQTDGITGATVELSPFWVSKVPSNPEKITFEIQETE